MNSEQRLRNRLVMGRSTATLAHRRDHGTHKCYVAGCRCDPCTESENHYSWQRKQIRTQAMWPRPLVWCRTGYHDKCPVMSAKRACPCDCHNEIHPVLSTTQGTETPE